ncbi:hypothetical protein CVT24_001127 [Panaeolus cyanescens]|uniref:Uncharacterized protein n=1 Tax=Panaeolus cyanescens TaxID=181874 RepID=A0A409YZ34_9AGAR|nr:hypothetical protein CVT24_001127 [Panaeolus cyanescens]
MTSKTTTPPSLLPTSTSTTTPHPHTLGLRKRTTTGIRVLERAHSLSNLSSLSGLSGLRHGDRDEYKFKMRGNKDDEREGGEDPLDYDVDYDVDENEVEGEGEGTGSESSQSGESKDVEYEMRSGEDEEEEDKGEDEDEDRRVEKPEDAEYRESKRWNNEKTRLSPVSASKAKAKSRPPRPSVDTSYANATKERDRERDSKDRERVRDNRSQPQRRGSQPSPMSPTSRAWYEFDLAVVVALVSPIGNWLTGGDHIKNLLLIVLLIFYLHQIIEGEFTLLFYL